MIHCSFGNACCATCVLVALTRVSRLHVDVDNYNPLTSTLKQKSVRSSCLFIMFAGSLGA